MEEYMKINQCIQLLKETHLPTIKKLRVEIQLIQMKRHVLSEDIATKSTCGSCDQPLFDGIMNQMVNICGGNYNGETLTDVVERFSWLLTAADKHEGSKAPQPQPMPIQGFPSHIAATA